MTIIVPLPTAVPLLSSKSKMICSQCGDLLNAPEESYEFSEEGIVIKLWSCYCGNQFETDEKIAHAVADGLLAA